MVLSHMDLFAGCGGMSLGLENAGFRPCYVGEVNLDALGTYLENRGDPDLLRHTCRDVRSIADQEKCRRIMRSIRDDYDVDELDMICGGPPCQGFSGIGHRRAFDVSKRDMPYNHLYKDMARIISYIRPRSFVFENVAGLLSGRWTRDGNKGEIWNDVHSCFESLDYDVGYELLHARDYGVPQFRPRIIMVGIRKDIRPDYPDTPGGGRLPAPSSARPPDPVDLIGDLVDPDYMGKKATTTYLSPPSAPVQHRLRNGLIQGDILTDQEYSVHADHIRKKFQHMLDHGGEIPEEYKTKKFSQRVVPERWGADGPNMTITSSQVDFVHFSQPRHMTVREHARFQTFPDTYKFMGPQQTGGRRRAGDPDKGIWDRDVPKYTQIANAVPVWLAEAVGRHVASLIR